MSFYKQLLILTSLLFLLTFVGNFAVSVNGMREYFQLESKIHAQDTATSLGLSLSPHLADPHDPILETMIRAIYDMGYYQEIKLVDVDGRTLVRFNDGRVFTQVPQWFINWLPIETATATSEISAGWSIAGIVSVSINPGYAYLKLYQQIQAAFYYSLMALMLSLLLLAVVLRLTLKPLQIIDRLAKQIAVGRFSRIDRLPWTTEVRNVAVSMNLMSDKIAGVITGLNQKLAAVGQRLLHDQVTGLYCKSSFEADLERLVHSGGQGYICSLKINDFAEVARNRGDAATDRFLKEFADILSESATQEDPSSKAYRFYGSEFALLLEGLRADTVESFARHLQEKLTWLGEQSHKPDLVHIGIAPFNPHGTTEGIVAAANDACEQASLIGVNSYVICRENEPGKTAEEWRELVFSIVDTAGYCVSYMGQVKDFSGDRIIMEEAFTQAFDEAGNPIPIGLFVSMAEKFEKIVDLDTGVTRQVMARLRAGAVPHGIAINLSMATLKSGGFRVWLIDLLRQNAALAGHLVFSVTAYSAAKNIVLFRDFTDFVHRYGARVLLKRYDTQCISVETLKSLKPDYVRIARDLTLGICNDSGKRLWVETMKEVGELLEIGILAENVQGESDFSAVKNIGLAGASR
ncbi:LapD/MoxY N-terminal periplasmic domain-containing protein [uncultured Thiodictyon sp.]|uniref:bifunctional diguanylate cyclase/phosphodiesterase n=1 Tax=uncultured Thiodictyon sp. TaxID=1846217 RepID=UPI0025EA7482|nr:LapD/MoxY N-terminal periplasmic domain-containing protein [uncultured Thiodictyon sp.]